MILVAGVGNVFLGDDGFGPEVARRLGGRDWPDDVRVADFGVRSLDLARALTSGVDVAILVDAFQRGGKPGTLYVIDGQDARGAPQPIDSPSHVTDPAQVLRFASGFGKLPPVVRVVGCEPAPIPVPDAPDDPDANVGLSLPVERAVRFATAIVAELVSELRG